MHVSNYLIHQMSNSAVLNGHVAVLDWMIGNEMLTTRNAVTTAAGRREAINFLVWARERGFDFSTGFDDFVYTACWFAAHYGILTNLQWLRQNGCPWGRAVVETARRFGHNELAEWAIANGCPEE